MKGRLAALLLAAALVVAGGCATLRPEPPPRPEDIAAALEADRISEADALIARLRAARPGHPDLPGLVRRREAAARALRERAAAAVEAAPRTGRWGEALAALARAERALPADPALAALRRRLERARATALARLDCALARTEAEHLAARLPLAQARARVLADELAPAAAVAELGRRLQALRGPLLACAERALAQGRLEAAEAFVRTARRAGASAEARAIADRIAARRAEAARAEAARRAASQAARRRAALEAALDRGRKALAASRIAEALAAAREAGRLAPDDPRARALWAEAEAAARKRAGALKRQGQALYARDRVREALALWREAAALAPDDAELGRWIARAERVLEGLRRLQAPGATAPPAPHED